MPSLNRRSATYACVAMLREVGASRGWQAWSARALERRSAAERARTGVLLYTHRLAQRKARPTSWTGHNTVKNATK